jgi:hypothetical protein
MDIDSVGKQLEDRGLTDEQIDEFLEHHGVKGQKWGVRRATKLQSMSKQTVERNLNVQRKVGTVGAAYVGAKATGLVLAAIGASPAVGVAGAAAVGLSAGFSVHHILQKHGAKTLSQLKG